MLTKVKTNISNIWSSCESIRYFSWRRKKWESLNSFCLQYRHASQYSLNLFAQQLEMKFFNSKLKWWYPMKLPLEKSFSIDLFLYHKNWINFVPDFSFFFEQICTKFCILSSMPENMTSTTSQNENICHFLHYLSYLPELVLNYVLASQCSSVMVSRKKMYKICHYTHHFIWCFAHWNLVSNKYFNYALLSKCNFSDFQYWNLDQNESLRGKKAVFWVSCPNCTSQNLKIEFCITTCDVTKNFY